PSSRWAMWIAFWTATWMISSTPFWCSAKRARQPPIKMSLSTKDAAAIIRDGGLVVFPTETVYGLGANALDAAAVQKIFELKGRPETSPLIVHVSSVEMAREIVTEWPARAEELARHWWPGPLTLVLP